MAKEILVATHKKNPVARLVVQKLRQAGCAPHVIATDDICEGDVPFSFTFSDGQPTLSYGDQKINLNHVGSAWYWRAIVACNDTDTASKKPDIEREMQKTLWGVWESIPEQAWLNPPYTIKRTQNKIMQLRYAALAGLRSIPTVATNSWDFLEKTMPDTFMFKMPGKGLIGSNKHTNVMYSTTLTRGDIPAKRHTSPFPGMYQPFLSKKREWRVTIVGENVFSAAIYTDKSAKHDWRQRAHIKDSVQFVAEAFPTQTANQCKKLLQLLGLRYGAFDFIETENNELYFVEVNSNGQYLWLEENLGLPISQAIADELIRIASE